MRERSTFNTVRILELCFFTPFDPPLAVLENVNPDLSDSEFMEQEEQEADMQEGGIPGSDALDAQTPGGGGGEDGSGEEDEGELDEELAAELDLALGDGEADEEGEDGEDDEEESDEEDEDDEDDEGAQERKLLNEEIRDLEAAVAKKNMEISSSANPLIRVSAIRRTCLMFVYSSFSVGLRMHCESCSLIWNLSSHKETSLASRIG